MNDIEIAPPSVVLQAAADFVYALTETLEYKSFERADDFLRKDMRAQQALSEFQKKWKSSEALIQLNALSTEEQQELERLRQAYITEPSVVAYVQAQADLVELCRVAEKSISQATGLIMRLFAALDAVGRDMMNTQTDQTYADFLNATDALAENLACSEQIVAYHSARVQLDADHQVQALLQQLGQLQSEIRASQARGAVTQADIENLRALQREAQTNPTIINFALTQQAAVEFLREINQTISQLLGFDFAAMARPSGGCC